MGVFLSLPSLLGLALFTALTVATVFCRGQLVAALSLLSVAAYAVLLFVSEASSAELLLALLLCATVSYICLRIKRHRFEKASEIAGKADE